MAFSFFFYGTPQLDVSVSQRRATHKHCSIVEQLVAEGGAENFYLGGLTKRQGLDGVGESDAVGKHGVHTPRLMGGRTKSVSLHVAQVSCDSPCLLRATVLPCGVEYSNSRSTTTMQQCCLWKRGNHAAETIHCANTAVDRIKANPLETYTLHPTTRIRADFRHKLQQARARKRGTPRACRDATYVTNGPQ